MLNLPCSTSRSPTAGVALIASLSRATTLCSLLRRTMPRQRRFSEAPTFRSLAGPPKHLPTLDGLYFMALLRHIYLLRLRTNSGSGFLKMGRLGVPSGFIMVHAILSRQSTYPVVLHTLRHLHIFVCYHPLCFQISFAIEYTCPTILMESDNSP
jgi:hypothetical protein